MQCCCKFAKRLSAILITALVLICLLIVGCGDSPARLTNSEILATADAIRTQTPTPIRFKYPEDCGKVKPTDEHMSVACDEKLNAEYADYISSQATAAKQAYDEFAATDQAENAHYDDYESTKMAATFEAEQEYFATTEAGTLEPANTALQESQVVETPTPSTNTSAIQWDKAAAHAGESAVVCGPVAGTRYATTTKGAPTFINLGVDYPDSQRFTVVIWGRDRANFDFLPEEYYLGKNLCAAGTISMYRGIAQIEVGGPGQIEIK